MSKLAAVRGGPPSMTRSLIELVDVEKVDRSGKLEYPALRGIDLSISEGEMVAIVGPSGSGKSTIINMITGIDPSETTSPPIAASRPHSRCSEYSSWRSA